MLQHTLIRSVNADVYLESFLMSAVGTLLIVRFYLHLTGFPQLGGNGLHIAHMLWGGLFMLIAIVVLLSFLNSSVNRVASIVGGIGFGLFIDELGKFITHDNNYFFEPTIAIIYVIFILMFLAFRFIGKTKRLTQEECLENAFVFTRMYMANPKNFSYKDRALGLLLRCDRSNPAAEQLSAMLKEILPQKETKSDVIDEATLIVHHIYKFFVKRPGFIRSIVIFFVILSIFSLLHALQVADLYFRHKAFELSYIEIGQLSSSIASSLMVIAGISRIRKSAVSAYKYFRIAVLISLFLTQFFDFFDNQLSALGIFFLNIFVLLVLDYLINHGAHFHKNTA